MLYHVSRNGTLASTLRCREASISWLTQRPLIWHRALRLRIPSSPLTPTLTLWEFESHKGSISAADLEERKTFGVALGEMQEGKTAALPVRPMPSIAAGVFELKDSDQSKWYRLVYLARVEDTIYVLHCFTKNTSKTEKRDLATAEQLWKQV